MKKTYTEVSAEKLIDLCNQRKHDLVYEIQGEIENHISRNIGQKKGGFFSSKRDLRTRQDVINGLHPSGHNEIDMIWLIASETLWVIKRVEDMKSLAEASHSGIVHVTLDDMRLINQKRK